MLCDVCGKEQATVHLTEIIDDQMTELHLCDKCAQAKGAHIQQPFSLSDLLSGLVGLGKELPQDKGVFLKCDNCGLTYDDFKKTGKLGCGRCYDVFKEILVPFLKRIHGTAKHVGRVPPKTGVKVKYARKIQILQSKLQRAIDMEEFEEAAKIRDQIKEIELTETEKNNLAKEPKDK